MQVYKDAYVWDVMFVIEQLGCVLYNNASLKKYLTVSLEINMVSVPQPMETKINFWDIGNKLTLLEVWF